MAARFPQSGSPLAWRIKPAWAGKVYAIWWVAGADSLHRLLPSDTATTIITRSASGATYNSSEGRLEGTSTEYFTDAISGGFGGLTEQDNFVFGAAMACSTFNGVGSTRAIISSWTPPDSSSAGFKLYGENYEIGAKLSGGSGTAIPGMPGSVRAFRTIAVRHDQSDAAAKRRVWVDGSEQTGWQANPSKPSSTSKIGDSGRPVYLGGSYTGTGDASIWPECFYLCASLSDADMATLTANPASVIEEVSSSIAFSGTVPAQNATVGTPFSLNLSTYFSGTETPFAYTLQSGTLPDGLSLNASTGVISGTPTTPGTASGIVIRATDDNLDTADSNSFSIDVAAADTTAPVLTSPTGTATGQTTASGTVSTDEANGTLYWLASTNSSESAATVKGGSSQAVTATGGQSVSVTGLTAATGYYLHYVHRDAAGNDSTVASSSLFTTDAVPGVRIQLHDGTTEQASLTGLTVAWFDDDDPVTFGAPVLQSAAETTDASGWLEVDLDGYTALGVGDPGFLIVYKAGATAPDDIVFAGRLAIEDIG